MLEELKRKKALQSLKHRKEFRDKQLDLSLTERQADSLEQMIPKDFRDQDEIIFEEVNKMPTQEILKMHRDNYEDAKENSNEPRFLDEGGADRRKKEMLDRLYKTLPNKKRMS